MDSHHIGKDFEQRALSYLKQQGLSLVSQNFHSRQGEIDLIMTDGKCLIFIEVRFRKTATYGSAIESVTRQKQARIIHTAQVFLQQHSGSYLSYRFDVVAINPSQSQNEIIWIKDAFQLG
ncbi:MAG: YraN family protein [Gammaproteobacteria bacterium]|nr:YraN family protein [Gammaproteobacteria bacterium]